MRFAIEVLQEELEEKLAELEEFEEKHHEVFDEQKFMKTRIESLEEGIEHCNEIL